MSRVSKDQAGAPEPAPEPPWVLALAEVVVAVQLAAFAVAPPTPGTSRGLDLVMAAGMLVLAAMTRWFGRRSIGSAVITCSLVSTWLVVSAATATRVTPQGAMAVGLDLVLLGVFVAAFLSARAATAQTTGMLAAFAIATYINPVVLDPLYLFSLLVVVATTVAVVARLAANLRRTVEEARTASRRDPLTGLLNRRGLDEQAQRVRAVDLRADVPTAVVVVDLDGFKAVNDEQGHEAGDALLSELAGEWAARARAADVLARIGGDEFVFVLPGAGLAEAEAMVARMRAGSTGTWSYGLALWQRDEDLWAAISHADQALYARKRAARESGSPGVSRA